MHSLEKSSIGSKAKAHSMNSKHFMSNLPAGHYGLSAEGLDFIINYDTCPVTTGSNTATLNVASLGREGEDEEE